MAGDIAAGTRRVSEAQPSSEFRWRNSGALLERAGEMELVVEPRESGQLAQPDVRGPSQVHPGQTRLQFQLVLPNGHAGGFAEPAGEQTATQRG